jgi:hypothetical protein
MRGYHPIRTQENFAPVPRVRESRHVRDFQILYTNLYTRICVSKPEGWNLKKIARTDESEVKSTLSIIYKPRGRSSMPSIAPAPPLVSRTDTKGTKLNYIFILCTVLFPFLTIVDEKIFLSKSLLQSSKEESINILSLALFILCVNMLYSNNY